jgi:hypothetical protein
MAVFNLQGIKHTSADVIWCHDFERNYSASCSVKSWSLMVTDMLQCNCEPQKPLAPSLARPALSVPPAPLRVDLAWRLDDGGDV